MRSVTRAMVIAALAAGLAACATPRGAYLDKDEPENRLLSSQMSGTVTRVDQPQQVVVLDNGQMYRVAGPDAVYVDGRPAALSSVQPGSTVTIVSGTPAGSAVRIYGRVVEVDRNEIKIRTQDGHAFEVRMPAGTVVRKGDPVTVDMTFGGAPAASPR